MNRKARVKNKKCISSILTVALSSTLVAGCIVGERDKVVYGAPGNEIYYFAEGFGTGVDFAEGNNSWVIQTT